MEIKDFEGFGRKLMVEFSCRRCNAKAYKPLFDCLPSDYPVRNLSDLKAPKKMGRRRFLLSHLLP